MSEPGWNVAQLRAALVNLPDDMPVAVADDQSFDPLREALVRPWKWEPGWGVLEYSPEPYDEPGDHEGFTPALVLSAKDWTP